MNRRQFLWAAGAVPALAQRRSRRPNVALILVDDWGWKDAAFAGSGLYETPNIDRLAASGVKFTQAYSACTVCSPSRAAIMTGEYPARLHLTDYIPGEKHPYAKLKVPDWTMYLPLEQRTIAEQLKDAGYATGMVGKWHLGPAEYWPLQQGFDFNFGGGHLGAPKSYFSPYGMETVPDGPPGEFLTERLTNEAVRWMGANKSKPFFLYLPHHTVHNPLQAKPEVVAKYEAKFSANGLKGNAKYAAMVESLDDSVGAVLQSIRENGVEDDTIVILTSDNGGLAWNTDNSPLRSGKGSPYEGGVRIPLMVRWPGVTKAGASVATPVIGADLYPTIVEMAGAKLPQGQPTDGKSLVPLLRGQRWERGAPLYWHYPHYHAGGARPHSAIRDGDLRLIEFFEDGHVELYDLSTDASESHDLSKEQPRDAARLQAKLAAWRESVGAQIPQKNPNYDPAKAK